MARHITLIQGHPDPDARRFSRALAQAYADGARGASREVRVIDVAQLEFPLLRSQADWAASAPPPALKDAQDAIAWAHHLVLFYPLWLGTMPAFFKGFLEQVLRPGFARETTTQGGYGKPLLLGRSARIVVTMGMPAFVYRWYFGAHSLKSLERNTLRFCGIGPIRESLIGSVGSDNKHGRERWLAKMRVLGTQD
jgi:putative NADPH-quinone reductase